jgi:hypothetical protein
MGALIQIAAQLFYRTLIALVAFSFTFIGQTFDAKLNQSSTTAPQLNISPIFVQIEDKNVDVEKNKIVIASTTNKTTATSSKNIVTKKPTVSPTAKIVPPPVQPTPAPTPTTKVPAKENPSLNDLPVPTIELPQITNEINRGIALGEWNNIYTNSKQSVVNIFCVATKGNMVSISTGSGVVINEKGYILTNSHVAENFLVPGKDCSIRQGEIASDKYKASLVYINENWLRKNAGVLFTKSARGTGENDFALLSINSKIDGSGIDSNILHTDINQSELTEQNKGNKILIAGYPASTLGALSLRKYLNFVADVNNISNVFTLDGTHVDVFETEVTKVGQHGSSGGGIFDAQNHLVGLIVSVSDESGNAKINALTTTYISRTLKNETGKTLEEFLSTDKNILLASFLLKQNSLFEYVKPFLQ